MHQEERLLKYEGCLRDLADAMLTARLESQDYRNPPDLLDVATALVDLMSLSGNERGLLEATRLETYTRHGAYRDEKWDDYDDEKWGSYPGHGAG